MKLALWFWRCEVEWCKAYQEKDTVSGWMSNNREAHSSFELRVKFHQKKKKKNLKKI
jgi:hypothetical protein